MSKFKVGDRVVGLTESIFTEGRVGCLGTVVYTPDMCGGQYGVEFDKEINGHNFSGFGLPLGKFGYCSWCLEKDIKLAEPVFLDKFEKGKKYVFDKATYETWSIQTCGKVRGLGWQNDIDGLIVDVIDAHDGDVGLYSVMPEWCKEVKEDIKLAEEDKPKLLDKFEPGKKYVFRKALHDTDLPVCSDFTWTRDVDGKVVKVIDRYSAEYEIFTISPQWCEEVKEEKETPKYYNGRVVCLSKDRPYFTKGKIYDVVNGLIIINDDDALPLFGYKFKTFEDLVEYFADEESRTNKFKCHWSEAGVKFIEVVE